MAVAGYEPQAVAQQSNDRRSNRSALGIGVTTLVTIMVVLLLAAFAVLSLVSARSDLSFSQTAAASAASYYAADAEATSWYAELDGFVAQLSGAPQSFTAQLASAGYTATTTSEGELRVTGSFTLSEFRSLNVTVEINDDKTTTIRQWQA